jgi:two-component system OmpR family response regulator
MSEHPHILLVDDERSIRDPLAAFLTKSGGMRVTAVQDAAEARQVLAAHAIDLVLLDIMMPGEGGLSLLGFIRATMKVPEILLTARTEETDRVVGLEVGADDYVSKPFSPRELEARIRAVLRRVGEGGAVRAPDAAGFAFGPWVLKTGERELVDAGGVVTPLSTGEYNLLLALVERPRHVLTRDQLLDLTQGRELAAFERSIDNHISRLRKKIEADPANPALIKTVWGGGYTLAADVRRL